MSRPLLVLIVVAAVAGCAQNMAAAKYVVNKPTVVPAAFPQLQITQLNGFEDAQHPGKLYVTPSSSKRLGIALSGRETQWSAMLPAIEPVYRDAALQILKVRGHADCIIDAHVPVPKELGIEYAFRCAS